MPADRQSRILAHISEGGTARVDELANELGVSVVTIRRDLQHLENQGLLNRVFGGAVSTAEMSYAPRSQAHVAEKSRIAKRAAALVAPGETVALETGTTVVAVAGALRASSLAIVTNSVDALLALQGRPDVTVVMTGGTFDVNTRCMYGGLVERFYADYKVDKLFIGAGSLGLDGLRDSNIHALESKRAAIAAAQNVIVVADSSKLQVNALALVCEWGQVSTLVTDASAPAESLSRIRAAGVDVLTA
jgi:DeoR family transcriptional regulator, fructose operon transcriptional repressor